MSAIPEKLDFPIADKRMADLAAKTYLFIWMLGVVCAPATILTGLEMRGEMPRPNQNRR
jgi:hypothetical protein